MGKSKHQMTARLQKKMKKEVRAGAQKATTTPETDTTKGTDLLSSFSKAKNNKKQTTVSPQVVHVEGQRWIKTLQKQTIVKKKVVTRRMSKKGSK